MCLKLFTYWATLQFACPYTCVCLNDDSKLSCGNQSVSGDGFVEVGKGNFKPATPPHTPEVETRVAKILEPPLTQFPGCSLGRAAYVGKSVVCAEIGIEGRYGLPWEDQHHRPHERGLTTRAAAQSRNWPSLPNQ